MASFTGLAKRAGWNLVDQALSALGNMLLMVVVARDVSRDDFGAFAIGFLVYGVAVAIGRAVVGQPLQILHSSDAPEQFRVAVARGQGVTVQLGLAIGILCALIGWGIGDAVGGVLLAVAVCLPLLMVQDVLRMAFFANGRADQAALIDVVKVVTQFAGLFGLIGVGITGVGWLTLSWGVAAAISAVVGMVLLRARPVLKGSWAWVRRQRKLTKYLLAEYTLGLGAAQLGGMLVPVLGTPRDAGAIRGSETLLGPLNVLWTASLAFAVPEISRRRRLLARQRVQVMAAISGAMTVVACTYVVVLLVLPDAVGQALFGDSWAGAQSVLLPMGLNSIASAMASGPGAMMIGMGLAKKTFRLNLAKAPILLGLLVPGTLMYGAPGAAWAMAISEAVLLPFWTYTAWRGAHGHYDHHIEHLQPTTGPQQVVDAHGEPVSEPGSEVGNAPGSEVRSEFAAAAGIDPSIDPPSGPISDPSSDPARR